MAPDLTKIPCDGNECRCQTIPLVTPMTKQTPEGTSSNTYNYQARQTNPLMILEMVAHEGGSWQIGNPKMTPTMGKYPDKTHEWNRWWQIAWLTSIWFQTRSVQKPGPAQGTNPHQNQPQLWQPPLEDPDEETS